MWFSKEWEFQHKENYINFKIKKISHFCNTFVGKSKHNIFQTMLLPMLVQRLFETDGVRFNFQWWYSTAVVCTVST